MKRPITCSSLVPVLVSVFLSLSAGALFANVVDILYPSDGDTVGGIVPVEVTFSSAKPYSPVSQIGGGIFVHSINPSQVSGSFTHQWDTSQIPNGTLKTLRLQDNYGFYDLINVTINNPTPALMVLSPAEGERIPVSQTTLPLRIAYSNIYPNYHGIRLVSAVPSGSYGVQQTIRPAQTFGSVVLNPFIGNSPVGLLRILVRCEDDSGKATTGHITINRVIVGDPVIDPKRLPHLDSRTFVGEPINVATGAMYTDHTDINIAAREIPLVFSRMYCSDDAFNGQLGYGWRSNYDIVLSESANGSVIEVDETGVAAVYYKNTDGTYSPSQGNYSSIVKNANGTYTIKRKHGRVLDFDASNRLVRIEERNGNTVSITRTANGAITAVTDASGRQLTFTSDAQGKLTQITDPAGRTHQYSYDADNNLVQYTDPLNNITAYQYDLNHKLTRITDANNHTTDFQYDAQGRAYHSWQDNNNNAVTLSFDTANNVTTVTDSLGRVTVYTYNPSGLVTKVTDSLNHSVTTIWDASFNKLMTIDQNGHATINTYDTRGNLLTVTDALNQQTVFTYETDFYFIKTVTDALGNVTTYDYDSKGNLTQVIDALGNITTHTYDTAGQLVSTTDAANYTTSFTYDSYGYPVTVIDALNRTTSYLYESTTGNCLQTTDPAGYTTVFTYDNLNRLTQTTYPDGSIAVFTYDALGNKTSVTDNASHTITYVYDLNNKVVDTVSPLGYHVVSEYDSEGNLVGVTDQDSHETAFVYDAAYRLTGETNPLGSQKSYEYDPAGNRVAMTDAKSARIVYTYDALNRLKTVTYPDTSVVTYSYDALGRRKSFADPSGTTSYTYDKLGRVTQIDGPLADDTISYTYDSLGNRASMVLPGSRTVAYAYDALSRLSSITDPDSGITQYTYDTAGNPATVTYPNGIRATYTFDSMHRLTRLTNANQTTNTVISDYIYTYDASGRKSSVTALDGVVQYQYDAAGQLTSEIRTGTYAYQIAYEYDPAGNRSRMIKDGIEHVYTYNAANQLTTEQINGAATYAVDVTGTVSDANGISSVLVNGTSAVVANGGYQAQVNIGSGLNTLSVVATDNAGNTASSSVAVTYNRTKSISYTYDNNGNLVTRQGPSATLSLTYDYENRLITASGGGVDAEYQYDGLGRRISTDNGGVVTKYLYDGKDVAADLTSAGVLAVMYMRNPSSAGGIGGIISVKAGTDPRTYYSYDGLGSVANISNAAGESAASYAYDAFGNVLTAAGNARGFLTKESDETGFVYFGARYYDPRIGRFITEDPSGMVDGPNVYLYCLNDPVNFVDMWGLSGWLRIYSLSNSKDSSSLQGHSWISYTPDDSGRITTYGTWGNTNSPGLVTNKELSFPYHATRGVYINDQQESVMFDAVQRYVNMKEKGWTWVNPCSSFAANVWESSTGESLQHRFLGISNPTTLRNAILNANVGEISGVKEKTCNNKSSSF